LRESNTDKRRKTTHTFVQKKFGQKRRQKRRFQAELLKKKNTSQNGTPVLKDSPAGTPDWGGRIHTEKQNDKKHQKDFHQKDRKKQP